MVNRAPGVSYRDLRDWLTLVDSIGELKRIEGADWNLEIGTIAELIYRERPGVIPALLFDNIQGYPQGFRILFGQQLSLRRLALILGLPLEANALGLVDLFRQKLSMLEPLPPRIVDHGAVLENRLSGEDVDLFKFPVPLIHELDGGRFIGTACIAITRDPDEGWVNLGTYRAMAHDSRRMGLFTSSVSKHGRIHMEKYFRARKPCPVVVCVGQDPLLVVAGGHPIESGYSEYDYCGGLK
ncbi:MAG TPA: UbiD family decarboxylase, partial [Candidatus Binatia bacterium]|nr:UbiD family decarboxylase [Candidatus Binatia bacterium]